MAEKSLTKNWIWSFLRPMRKIFAEMLAMSVFVNIMALAVPVFTLQVYDRVVFSAGLSTLQGLVIGVVLVVIFDYVIRQSRSRIMQTVALRVDVEVGKKLFDKVTSLPLNILEAQPSGFWQALFRDVDMVRNTLSGAPAILLADLPFTIIFFVIIFIIAQPVIPVLIVIWALYLFIAWRSSSIMTAANREERQTTQSRDALISELITGRTTVKALGLERAMRPMWVEAHADNIDRASARGAKTDAYSNLGGTLSMVTTIGLTSVGAIAIINQEMTMGALIATNMLSGRLLGPLNQLVGTWRIYSSFMQAVERLGDIFSHESDRMDAEITMSRPEGEIALEDVTFSYGEGGPKVLDSIRIGIRPGGLTAIVGRNGCGKTTMIKLMQGLYRPTSGRVLLDGADISQFSRKELVNWVGYVPQETVLFAGTIRDNIAYGFPEASDDDIINAATAAGVHKFIIDLPDGYGTEIGEAGRILSGGQRQRIAIARALVKNPAVLLLDEPSGNLDRQAEEELRETLKELSKDHTVILITHSTVLLQGCDNLIALDRGKIALAGPAKEILPRLFGSRRRPEETPVETPPEEGALDANAGTKPGEPAKPAAAPAAAGNQPANKTSNAASNKPANQPAPQPANSPANSPANAPANTPDKPPQKQTGDQTGGEQEVSRPSDGANDGAAPASTEDAEEKPSGGKPAGTPQARPGGPSPSAKEPPHEARGGGAPAPATVKAPMDK